MTHVAKVFLVLVVAPSLGWCQEKDRPGVVQLLGTEKYRTGDRIGDLAYSPDGRLLVAVGFNSVQLLDGRTGELIRRWAHFHPARVAFTADSKALIVAGAGDSGTRLYDVATEKEQRVLLPAGAASDKCVFSADHKKLVVAHQEKNRIIVWNLETGKEETSWETPDKVWQMALSPDGKTLATLGQIKGVNRLEWLRVWDVATAKERYAREDPKAGWGGLAISPDNKWLAAGNREFHLLHLATGEEKFELKGHLGYHGPVAFSPDGSTLATGGAGLIGLWDVASGKKRHLIKAHAQAITRLAFSPDGTRIASGDGYGVIQIWDTARGEALTDLTQPTFAILRLLMAPDGETLGALYDDGVLRIWDRKTGKVLSLMEKGMSSAGSISSDGKWVLVPDGVVNLYDAATGKKRSMFLTEAISHGGRRFSYACFGPDGKTVAATGDTTTITIWDIASGKVLEEIPKVWSPSSIAMAPDGKTVVIGTVNGEVVLFDRKTAREVWKTRVETPMYFTNIRVQFGPGGRTILAQGGNLRFALLDAHTGKRISLAGPFPDSGGRFDLSPDGRMLVSNDPWMSARGIVRVYEMATGGIRLELKGHLGQVQDVAFTPDGLELASGGRDTTILFWDLSGRQRFGAIKGKVTRERFAQLWEHLGAKDAARAYEAILELAHSGQAPVYLEDKLFPVNSKTIEAAIAGLADDLDSVREETERELIALGPAALEGLQEAFKKKFPSAEAASKIPLLITRIEAGERPLMTLNRLRISRALEVLERDGSKACQDLLTKLAEGLPEAELTREARFALARLRDRKGEK